MGNSGEDSSITTLPISSKVRIEIVSSGEEEDQAGSLPQ
jgi:hypothetical protein